MSPCDELLKLAPAWFPGFLTFVLLLYNTWLTRRAERTLNGRNVREGR